MQCNNIVKRSQTGKLILSDAKMELVEREVAHHLGVLHRDFGDGKVQDGDIFNADETHFVINMHSNSMSCTEGDEVGSPSAEHARSEGALMGCRETTRKGPVRGRARSAVEKVRKKEWE